MTDDNIIRPIFSIGISTFEVTNINNESLIEYSKKRTYRNKVKEKKNILSNPIFEDLNKFVEDRMDEYFSVIYKAKPSRIKLTEAWSNVGGDKLITFPHTHTAFISAVYYPLATEGDLVFLNPAFQTTSANYGSNKITLYNSDFFTFPARTGNLIVFPSKLQHMVRCSGSERISIAYNGMPVLQEPAVKSYLNVRKK